MADWTTRARVKRHLNLDASDTSIDSKLDDLIPAATKMLEDYIGHPLDLTTYTEYLDGEGLNEILLGQYPIVSITSIHDDIARAFGSDTLIPATDYVFNASENENVGYVRLFQNTTVFNTGIQNIKIVYVAGYSTIPAQAELACVQVVAWLLNRSGTEAQSAASLGGKSESYEADNLPMYIKRQVLRYKKMLA